VVREKGGKPRKNITLTVGFVGKKKKKKKKQYCGLKRKKFGRLHTSTQKGRFGTAVKGGVMELGGRAPGRRKEGVHAGRDREIRPENGVEKF